MKKFLLIGALLVCLANPAKAVVAEPVCTADCGASFFPFATAVTFAAFVVYANATGIPFPLCGAFNCYAEYPHDRNGE